MTADRTAYRTPPRWLRGWRLLVALTVVMLFITVLMILAAVMLSGNLTPIIRKAQAAGIATTWDELGLGHLRRDQALESRIQMLAKAHLLYFPYSLRNFIDQQIPGEPPHPGLQVHVKKIPDSVIKDIRDIYNCHSSESLQHPQFSPYRLHQLLQIQCEYACVSNEFNDELLDQLIKSAGILPIQSTPAQLNILQMICHIIRLRRSSLTDVQRVKSALISEFNSLDDKRRGFFSFRFVQYLEWLQMDPHQFAKEVGISIPSYFEIHCLAVAANRLGRCAVAQRQLDWLQFTRTCSDPTGASFSKFFKSGRGVGFEEKLLAGTCFGSFYYYDMRELMNNTRTALLATAALLDGSPWPNDPASAKPTPLRELTDADGTCYAIYSVGANGADDKGRGDDRVILLRKPPESAAKP